MVGLLREMDYGAYYFFRHESQHTPALQAAMQLGALNGAYVVAVVVALAAVALLMVHGKMRASVVTLAAFMLGVIFVEILRNIVAAPRPVDARDLVAADEMLRSFPARGVFALVLAAGLLMTAAWGASHRIGRLLLVTGPLLVLVIWAALSQMALGLHFLSDVLGGLSGGMAVALLATRLVAMPPTRQPASR
jgi:membrane-associated phospholipid phosphatase